jgi:hypothetical protein
LSSALPVALTGGGPRQREVSRHSRRAWKVTDDCTGIETFAGVLGNHVTALSTRYESLPVPPRRVSARTPPSS